MLIGLFDCQSLVHYDFIPKVKQWIKNSECFIASLSSAKQTTGTLAHGQYLHCDNALSVRNFPQKTELTGSTATA